MPNSNPEADVVVIGGGPAGLTAAIALAQTGAETLLVAAPAGATDQRTTALLAGSVTALEALGVWERCREAAAPLEVMRLIDDRQSLLRAPEVAFRAEEIGRAAFGYNIANADLTAALSAQATSTPGLTRIEAAVRGIAVETDAATVKLEDGRTIAAKLVIGADGRHSIARQGAGIAVDERRYPQTALTFNLAHTRPHGSASTEFHTETGPFTLVPLTGHRSSLVWVTDPGTAVTAAADDDAAVAEEIERRSHSILGKISLLPGRGVFPLTIQSAARLVAARIALVGEAAHVIPPIGAQGFNLGLRDAATIVEIVADARRDGADIGGDAVLARYDRMRRPDVASRSFAVDILNRSLLTGFMPAHGLRGFGLYLLDRVGPLRRAVMQEGIAPRVAEPRLMRGEML